MFDFSDVEMDTEGKEVKRLALLESMEYVTMSKEAYAEAVYPDVLQMVLLFFNIVMAGVWEPISILGATFESSR